MGLLQSTLVILIVAIVAGCASSSRPHVVIHDGPRGTVYLEPMPDDHLPATHPITLHPSVLLNLLRGIHVLESKTALGTLFTGEGHGSPAFTEDEIVFLAPLVKTALEDAEPHHRVVFHLHRATGGTWLPEGGGAAVGSSVSPTMAPKRETTSGTVYAHGRSLHFTLTQYRHSAVRSDAIGGPNRYYPGLADSLPREVRFVPDAIQRPGSYRQPQDTAQTIVVDSEALATVDAARPRTPGPGPFPPPTRAQGKGAGNVSVPPNPSDEDVHALKDLIIKKDMELEALKKDLLHLRRQLDERDVELERLRKKPVPGGKPSENLR